MKARENGHAITHGVSKRQDLQTEQQYQQNTSSTFFFPPILSEYQGISSLRENRTQTGEDLDPGMTMSKAAYPLRPFVILY